MKRKGLSIIEYAIVIFVAVAALVAMQSYLRKAICGSWRRSADNIGFGMQYEP